MAKNLFSPSGGEKKTCKDPQIWRGEKKNMQAPSDSAVAKKNMQGKPGNGQMAKKDFSPQAGIPGFLRVTLNGI